MKTSNRRYTKSMLSAAVLAACGLIWAGSASALPSFASGLVPGQSNTISDDDAEIFIDADMSGSVTTGDYFLGFLGMNTVQPSNEQPGTTINELTAVFALEVSAINFTTPASAVCGGLACTDFSLATPAIGLGAALDLAGFDYDPVAAGPQTAAAVLAGIAADTWLVAFEDTIPDFNVATATMQDLVDMVMDGTQVLELGDTGATIGSIGPSDPSLIAGLAGGVGIGSFSLSGAPINSTTLPLDTTVPVNGGGQVFAPGAGVAFPIKTNTDITVFAAIPEPTTLALLGAGLLGMGFSKRRRAAA